MALPPLNPSRSQRSARRRARRRSALASDSEDGGGAGAGAANEGGRKRQRMSGSELEGLVLEAAGRGAAAAAEAAAAAAAEAPPRLPGLTLLTLLTQPPEAPVRGRRRQMPTVEEEGAGSQDGGFDGAAPQLEDARRGTAEGSLEGVAEAEVQQEVPEGAQVQDSLFSWRLRSQSLRLRPQSGGHSGRGEVGFFCCGSQLHGHSCLRPSWDRLGLCCILCVCGGVRGRRWVGGRGSRFISPASMQVCTRPISLLDDSLTGSLLRNVHRRRPPRLQRGRTAQWANAATGLGASASWRARKR